MSPTSPTTAPPAELFMYYILSKSFPPGSLVYSVDVHPWFLLISENISDIQPKCFFLISGLHPYAEEFALSPDELLNFQPIISQCGNRMPPSIIGEKSWFENACHSSGCPWLVSLVNDIAIGKSLSSLHVVQAYSANNNGLLPETYR